MRFLCLATDYDGTLAHDGVADKETWEAVRRFRESGRKVVLVSGRDLDELGEIASPLDRFDGVVAENGGVLYWPASGDRRLLAPPPPPELIDALHDRGVDHFGVSSTLVATVKPYETIALQAIRDLGLELKLAFNKNAVMIMSPAVTKATGLHAALAELRLSPHNVVGIGDAENDHDFLDVCECAVAVANALPMLKKRSDFVTAGDHGRGVTELVDEVLADDLRSREPALQRRHILLGKRSGRRSAKDEAVRLPPYGARAMVAGPSGGGKSTVTTGLLERLATNGYQFCVFDPEGDYDEFDDAIVLGGAEHAPSHDEVLQLLAQPDQNVVVNLLRVSLADRPLFCAGLLPRLQRMRVETGRPHWLVFDEAHHLFPARWESAETSLPQQLETALLVTVHPKEVSPAVLRHLNLLLAVGAAPDETIAEFARSLNRPLPRDIPPALAKGEAVVWRPELDDRPPLTVWLPTNRTERRRHSRKYAEGLLIPERSFYFRGPEGRLNLRAYNLILFLHLAAGVDDETWLHHLRRHEYSQWFGEVIGDDELAGEARRAEADAELSADESREHIRAAVARRYTLPENPSLPKIAPPVSR
ncbi:MAG TPA: HAD hydrolase family protein [Pirellulales bacterium]|nr:HAD hydrolase family protein [Pirellulales bacterium]